MTAAHTIDRFTVRWGLVPDEQRRRAEQLQAALVDTALDDVLDAVGIASHEEVCVRDVLVPPYSFRWSDTDAQLLDGWSRAIASAIASAIAAAVAGGNGDIDMGSVEPGSNTSFSSAGDLVVRYRSLDHAVLDLVVSVLMGRTERAWAWAQLGLWPADLAATAAGASAGVRAELARLAVRTLRDHPHLVVAAMARLAGRAPVSALTEALGSDALVDLVNAAWVATGGVSLGWLEHAPRAVDHTEHVDATARSIVARSEIWRAAVTDARAITSGEAALSFAALALLEVEPALARSSQAEIVVRAVVGTEQARSDAVDAPHVETERVTDVPPEPEPARTAWGGLLFLVHVVVATGAVDRFLDRPGASARSLLHALGRTLVDRAATGDDAAVRDDDPALLAFCGLPPGSSVPETLGELDVGDEAALVVAAVHERVDAGEDDDPLRLVCRRDATVEAEPGWIDVVFALDDVSTDIRRAGLDLDPGYVPALGCVLRFRYA